jgi:hypothetical protein
VNIFLPNAKLSEVTPEPSLPSWVEDFLIQLKTEDLRRLESEQNYFRKFTS